jgi:hypothetical protein
MRTSVKRTRISLGASRTGIASCAPHTLPSQRPAIAQRQSYGPAAHPQRPRPRRFSRITHTVDNFALPRKVPVFFDRMVDADLRTIKSLNGISRAKARRGESLPDFAGPMTCCGTQCTLAYARTSRRSRCGGSVRHGRVKSPVRIYASVIVTPCRQRVDLLRAPFEREPRSVQTTILTRHSVRFA